ncbi:MAG: hypothetical protein OSB42_03885 [Planctomycetota bacterium]|nr:hypothetical protein [Planctomycetota bacterium]
MHKILSNKNLTAHIFPIFLLLFTACGGGGGASDDPGTVSAPTPGDLITIGPGPHPRIDLPGRLSVLLQVLSDDGRPVPGLSASDFVLRENGSLVSTSESQQRLLPKPRVFRAYAHLLLDLSGSVAGDPDGLAAELAAAHAFVDEALAEPSVEVAISWFFGAPASVPGYLPGSSGPLGFTSNAAQLHAAIDNVNDVTVTSNSTNLFGAVLDGLAVLDTAAANASAMGLEFFSLSLITFTDGTDQAGLVTRDAAVAALSAGDYSAYTIGLGNEIDTQSLTLLGPDGFVQAGDLPDLTPGFTDVAGDVRDLANSFYLVGYVSPKLHGSGSNTLRITASRDGDSASLELDFLADYFSGGAGFMESIAHEDVSTDSSLTHLAPWVDNGCMVTGWKDDGSGNQRTMYMEARDQELLPDSSFGVAGRLEWSTLGSPDHITPGALLFDPLTGKSHLAVTLRTEATDPNPSVQILRLNADGSTDVSWIPAPGPDAPREVVDLATHPGGGLVLLATRAAGDLAIWRILETPFDLDGSFGTGGIASWSVSTDITPKALAVRDDGRILVSGTAHNPMAAATDMLLVQWNSDGTLDTGFGTQGVLRNFGSFQNDVVGTPEALAIDVQDRALVVGRLAAAPGAAHPSPAFWRCDASGQPDLTWTGNSSGPYAGSGLVALGPVFTAEPAVLFGRTSGATAFCMRPDGSILAVGTRENAEGHTDLAWWRLDSQGRLDHSWNGTGFMIEDGTLEDNASESCGSLLIDGTGRVLAAGSSTQGVDPTRALLWIDQGGQRTFEP